MKLIKLTKTYNYNPKTSWVCISDKESESSCKFSSGVSASSDCATHLINNAFILSTLKDVVIIKLTK